MSQFFNLHSVCSSHFARFLLSSSASVDMVILSCSSVIAFDENIIHHYCQRKINYRTTEANRSKYAYLETSLFKSIC